MATIDPSLISDPSQQKWVDQISDILSEQLDIQFEVPPVSIFQVPEAITSHKPEAYEPQKVGLGPNHHFQQRAYKKMEQKKLIAVQRVLQDLKIQNLDLTVDKVRKLVPVVRACYDMFLQDGNVFLAWVFTIDGLFLLDLFHTYNNAMKDRMKEKELNYFLFGIDHPRDVPTPFEDDPEGRSLAQDIMMAGNQIPFMILKEINEALHPSSASDFSPSLFRSFSKIHSPLELCSESRAPALVEHLLHYMYYSIINNVPVDEIAVEDFMDRPEVPTEDLLGCLPCFSLFTLSNMDIWANVLNFLKKIPEDVVVGLYEIIVTTLEKFTKTKTGIPSAFELHDRAQIRFHPLPKDEGIQKIDIDGNKFYLPFISLHKDSEVILRNLVAYETLMVNFDKFPLTEYVGLMCGLIVNVQDVKLLKRENIIKGDLGEDEVAKVFNGLSSLMTITKTKVTEKTKLGRNIENVKKIYASKARMKAYSVLKKLAYWLLLALKAIAGFMGATWKIVAFLISIVTVVTLTWQAYCDIYGCEKTNDVLLTYASG